MKAIVPASNSLTYPIKKSPESGYSLWSSALGFLLEKLLAMPGQGETIKIVKKRDRQGNFYWRVYDLLRDESASFSSEAEVRCWLEQRYSR